MVTKPLRANKDSKEKRNISQTPEKPDRTMNTQFKTSVSNGPSAKKQK
tara:strand:+ start:425 stop:568 length:144 start_codon:yes stop_codon:yes gene_type:complete